MPPHFHTPFTLLPEEKYGCEVRVIPVDFSDGQEIYPRIAEELQDLDIGILGKVPSSSNSSSLWPCCVAGTHFTCCLCVLVNNVGYSLEYPAYFGEGPEEVSRALNNHICECDIHGLQCFVSIDTQQNSSNQLSHSSTGEVCGERNMHA